MKKVFIYFLPFIFFYFTACMGSQNKQYGNGRGVSGRTNPGPDPDFTGILTYANARRTCNRDEKNSNKNLVTVNCEWWLENSDGRRNKATSLTTKVEDGVILTLEDPTMVSSNAVIHNLNLIKEGLYKDTYTFEIDTPFKKGAEEILFGAKVADTKKNLLRKENATFSFLVNTYGYIQVGHTYDSKTGYQYSLLDPSSFMGNISGACSGFFSTDAGEVYQQLPNGKLQFFTGSRTPSNRLSEIRTRIAYFNQDRHKKQVGPTLFCNDKDIFVTDNNNMRFVKLSTDLNEKYVTAYYPNDPSAKKISGTIVHNGIFYYMTTQETERGILYSLKTFNSSGVVSTIPIHLPAEKMKAGYELLESFSIENNIIYVMFANYSTNDVLLASIPISDYSAIKTYSWDKKIAPDVPIRGFAVYKNTVFIAGKLSNIVKFKINENDTLSYLNSLTPPADLSMIQNLVVSNNELLVTSGVYLASSKIKEDSSIAPFTVIVGRNPDNNFTPLNPVEDLLRYKFRTIFSILVLGADDFIFSESNGKVKRMNTTTNQVTTLSVPDYSCGSLGSPPSFNAFDSRYLKTLAKENGKIYATNLNSIYELSGPNYASVVEIFSYSEYKSQQCSFNSRISAIASYKNTLIFAVNQMGNSTLYAYSLLNQEIRALGTMTHKDITSIKVALNGTIYFLANGLLYQVNSSTAKSGFSLPYLIDSLISFFLLDPLPANLPWNFILVKAAPDLTQPENTTWQQGAFMSSFTIDDEGTLLATNMSTGTILQLALLDKKYVVRTEIGGSKFIYPEIDCAANLNNYGNYCIRYPYTIAAGNGVITYADLVTKNSLIHGFASDDYSKIVVLKKGEP